ncbi:carbonyl reductase [Viridothelium virens]|uniref:Carbonyl reductase n=1 Tax=Viridothelium virens TaxID=1048519 RepID=A0A6A6H901_VIRVR|nr:carbonyl reductase [Viridothelium virens]
MARNSPSTIVLITGANQGIGFGTSRKLAKENNGWQILMGSRNAENGEKAAAELKQEGLSVEPLTIDITDDQLIERAVKEVESKYGRIDVLINNAGIANEGRRPDWSTRQMFKELFDTNVFGHHIVTENFESLLAKSSHPRVIFVSSVLASIHSLVEKQREFANVPLPVYRSSKTALNMIMAYWANKHKVDGWKVNSICPGWIGTNLNEYQGQGTVESGTIHLATMATAGKDGLTGTFSDKEGPIPW